MNDPHGKVIPWQHFENAVAKNGSSFPQKPVLPSARGGGAYLLSGGVV